MANLQWLHSGGSFNSNPSHDLGGFPSKFALSGQPPGGSNGNVMNNLFNNVSPENAMFGITDYRCFYIWNPSPTTAVENISVAMEACSGCDAMVNFGSNLINDVQMVSIDCTGFEDQPDTGGFIIFDTEFGPPFTIYWNDFGSFGSDMQDALQNLPWCDSVTVTGSNPYTITFMGEAGNRNVQLIRVVQNDLLVKGFCRYDTVTYTSCEPWNGYGKMAVKTVQPISNYVEPSGNLRIYNPLTGLWDSYNYSSYSGVMFTLTEPLQFNMVGFSGNCPPFGDVDDSQNWQRDQESPETGNPLPTPWGVVEAPLQDKNCQVYVSKKTQGSPINTYAAQIPTATDMPETTMLDMNAKFIGNLKPNEGFYLWVQRIVNAGANPCLQFDFTISLTATAVNWPLT